MKIQPVLFLSALFAFVLTTVFLVHALPAFATNQPPPVRVPGPSTLALLSLGAAVVAVGVRFINRRQTSLLADHEPTLLFCALFLAIAVAAIWEAAAPRRALTAALRSRWVHNFAIWGVGTVVARLIFPVTGTAFALLVAERGWGLFNLVGAPAWAAIPGSVVALDLGGYLQHRLFHRLSWLWRFHRVHHADPDYDFTLGFRFHPLETITGVLVGLGTIAIIGAPATGVLLHELAFILVSVLAHANARMPGRFERLLRRLIVTADLHRVHHSAIARETDSNFGSLLPWWDRLFGTHRDQPEAGHEGMRIGLDEFRGGKCLRLSWMLVHPLVTARLERRLFGSSSRVSESGTLNREGA